jgi:hypothetical protein
MKEEKVKDDADGNAVRKTPDTIYTPILKPCLLGVE